MASREKRALAPSKSKQKANNDSSPTLSSFASSASSSESNRNASSSKKTGGKQPLSNNSRSQQAREIFESVATGAPLPAKLEAILPRKRALQTALKRKQKAKKTLIKVKQKVPIKTLKRIAEAKKTIFNKKKKSQSPIQNSAESDYTKNKCKTAKKSKALAKASEEVEGEGQDKSSPKLGKKGIETSPKSVKGGKATAAQKRNDSKERDLKVKQSLSKEPEEVKVKIEPNDNSYELTIEEVIATSMLIEAELDPEGEESASEGELKGKKLLKNPVAKRSLRNGKLRQPLIKPDPDSDPKKVTSMSEVSVEPIAEQKSSYTNDVDTVTVKIEQNTDDCVPATVATPANHLNNSEVLETNNNGCEIDGIEQIEEVGPILRSKTKSRSSDETKPIADGELKPEDSKVAVKGEDSEKKERAPTKSGEMQVSGTNSPRSRRSSLNLDGKRPFIGNVEKMAAEGNGSKIDDMINEIKMSIAKTIESKLYNNDAQGSGSVKNYDIPVKNYNIPKLQKLIREAEAAEAEAAEAEAAEAEAAEAEAAEAEAVEAEAVEAEAVEAEAVEQRPETDTTTEMAEDADANSVPKVAITAKEVEKLVMGDTELAECELAKEKCDKSADDAAAKEVEKKAVGVTSAKEEQQSKDSLQSMVKESLDDSAGKDLNVKQSDDMKKPASTCPTRKSMRVTAGKSSSATDIKKSLNISHVANEMEESADEGKVLEKEKIDPIVKPEEDQTKSTVEGKTSDSESNENADENKTGSPMEISMDTSQDEQPSLTLEMSVDEEKTKETSTEVPATEETLESLSREVEKLVEDDYNENLFEKITVSAENDASSDDVEMQLVIEDEVSPTDSKEEGKHPQPQINDNEEGCEKKSSSKSPENVQKVENIVESTSVFQPIPETEIATIATKSAAIDEKSKEAAKAKPMDVEEVQEQKENRRVLRARGDKQKKADTTKTTSVPAPVVQEKSDAKVVKSENAATSEVPSVDIQESNTVSDKKEGSQSQAKFPSNVNSESIDAVVIKTEPEEPIEPQIRTRRSREVKKQPLPTKAKRGAKKQDPKKVEQPQQSKEETMLDNEVAKINENNKSVACMKPNEGARGVSANAGNTEQQKLDVAEVKNRSKSENDVRSTNLSSDILKPEDSILPATESMETEVKATSSKDSDEASSSSESSSSVEKIMETPEDRAKKEDILRQLGLESWEKANERKAKREQYTGTLKTIIRLGQKDGKKKSRWPLKMVLKQQGRTDGEESIDIYTIQKELGSGGLDDSSSGANRKLPTNSRHSCDEDNDDSTIKDRQSLIIIPEKSSSFSIHPERLCADNCSCCLTKFGSLDTPTHLAQMKSNEMRKKILETQPHLTKDSCLCDACYRRILKNTTTSPTITQVKPQRQSRHSIISCTVRNCLESGRHYVKRRWLTKIKPHIRTEIDVNWESSQHNLMTFCGTHYAKIEKFQVCILCKRRLVRNHTFPIGLTPSECEELNKRFEERDIPGVVMINTFVCKLCKFFISINYKNADFETISEPNKKFYKNYRKKLLHGHDIDEPESEEEMEIPEPSTKGKEKARSGNSNFKHTKGNYPENFDSQSTSTSEKSSPEPPKIEANIEPSESTVREGISTSTISDSRSLGIEGAIQKLKKRKALDTSTTSEMSNSSRSLLHNSADVTASTSNGSARNVVEILAMDKEVTLTRLPKRPRLSNTSSPNNELPSEVQRLGKNPSITVRTLFPGEEDMNLQASVEFNNVREVTPQGWEKCATMIQYDQATKKLWQELQRPYGNQSSFLRHLILLEKYYRTGDLILAPNASRNAINYSTSVHNRLISYEGPEKVVKPRQLSADGKTIVTVEYNNSRRLSGGCVVEQRDHHSSLASTSGTSSMGNSSSFANVSSQLSKLDSSSRVMKLTPGVSIIKKPPPNLQRLNTSGGVNGSAKRKESIPVQKGSASSGSTPAGGKVFQLSEPEFKRLQNLKRQKQLMNVKQSDMSPNSASGSSKGPSTSTQYPKGQQISQSQFQKHVRMQQEMLNQRSRSDFEPLICDIRTLTNENTPTQNLINNLNLPKSIQVTTKPPVASSTPIPIMPKIPKSLTVIPQRVVRTQDK